jgi:hypothetical protein
MSRAQYKGMEYEIVDNSVGDFFVFNWYVYDGAGSLDGQGAATSYGEAVRLARQYIDGEFILPDDDPPPPPGFRPPPDHVFVKPVGPPVKPGDFDGDGLIDEEDLDHYYPDFNNNGIADIFEDRDNGSNGQNGNNNGVEVEGDILNTAGMFVVGVTKGTLMVIIPIFTVSFAMGFMRRISKKSAEKGAGV